MSDTWSSEDDGAYTSHLARERVVDAYSKFIKDANEFIKDANEELDQVQLTIESALALDDEEISPPGLSRLAEDGPVISVGTQVEMACHYCEGPIDVVLREKEVMYGHDSGLSRHHYEIASKACDCPIVLMYVQGPAQASWAEYWRKKR